jgi:hypothetical protein
VHCFNGASWGFLAWAASWLFVVPVVVLRPHQRREAQLPSSGASDRCLLGMTNRVFQLVLVLSILWLSWLGMMLVHEGGHVLGGWGSGGRVRRVVWHPLVISRTDVRPNPHPLIEVWAGALVGSVVPLIVASVVSMLRWRIAYLFWVFAGFCLIANGAYLGVGAFHPVGDAKELLEYGAPRWILVAFGTIAMVGGFWTWDRISSRVGFGKRRAPVCRIDSMVTFCIAIGVTVLGFIFGNRG